MSCDCGVTCLLHHPKEKEKKRKRKENQKNKIKEKKRKRKIVSVQVSYNTVDQFSQTSLCYKAPNKGYLYICEIYKSNNEQPRYQVINNCKIFVC